MGRIITVTNQKGGVGKTTSTINIAAGLASAGKKVLTVDLDPQGSLTAALGYIPEQIENTTADLISALIRRDPIEKYDIYDHIIQCGEIFLLPANITLSVIDLAIVTATAREYLVSKMLNMIKSDFDYIIIDCLPSLGMLTINALTAADSVIVPIEAQDLAVKGFNLLRDTIELVQSETNHELKIEGVFLTKYNNQLKLAREMLKNTLYICENENIRMFNTKISTSTDAATASFVGKNIFQYKPGSKTATEYGQLVKEILENEQ